MAAEKTAFLGNLNKSKQSKEVDFLQKIYYQEPF